MERPARACLEENACRGKLLWPWRQGWAHESPQPRLHQLEHRRVWLAGIVRSALQDRKSTRLNSSHEWISYAVFCLKKKKKAKHKKKQPNGVSRGHCQCRASDTSQA